MSPSVVSAARVFADLALEEIRQRCPAQGDEDERFGFQRWVEDSQFLHPAFKRFDLRSFPMSAAQVCAYRELGRMRETAEFRAVADALRSDPVIGSRLGTEVVGGAGLGGGSWQAEGLIDALIIELMTIAPIPPPPLISSNIDAWHRYLSRQEEPVTVMAPLLEFESDQTPLELGAELAIVEPSSEEIAAMLIFGGWTVGALGADMPPLHSGFSPSVTVGKVFGLRTTYTAPVVYAGTPEQVQATLGKQAEAEGRIENALLTLRLFKRGRVDLTGVVRLIRDMWSRPQAVSLVRNLPIMRLRIPPYSVDVHEAADLTNFARERASSRVRRCKVIDASSRRFGYAAQRMRPDDEIVDLIIAAESLFLSDTGDPSERGEMTFRLSTRAGLFSDGTPEERKRVLRFMRDAYNARSGVVHSGSLNEAKLRTLGGAPATAGEFADDLEELVRRALKKVVRGVASGETFPPDWNNLLFG
jgi:hypothetical protein